MKKLIWALIAIVIIAVAYYLISPLWRTVEVDEALIFEDTAENLDDSETQQLNDSEDEMEILPPVEMNEPMPEEMADELSEPTVVASGTLIPDAHDVAGSVTVYEQGDQRILRFEDLDTVNGPNLHIYLATDASATDHVDLGEILATKGNVNYELKNAIDLSVYDHVLIWCVPFGINFSYAVLE